MLICKADTKYNTRIGLIISKKNMLKDNAKYKKTDLLTNKSIIHSILQYTIEKSHTVMMSTSACKRQITTYILWIAI